MLRGYGGDGPMDCRAEHIAVGSEILLGQIANGHAQRISQAFAAAGLPLYYHTAVGDNLERLRAVFAMASQRSNVIVVTGGLGPTADDLTREALAAHLGRPMHEVREVVERLEAYFRARGRQMAPENRKQGLLIEGGEFLPNPNGTAPGMYVRDGDTHYFLMPGPPLEMVPMLHHHVIPRVRALFGLQQRIVSRVLHFCGIGESDVDQAIPHLTSLRNPTVAPLAGEGEMLIRITAAAEDEGAAQALIAPIESELRNRFGPYIYGVDDDTLPKVVARLLREQGQTLAVAESCTGGLLSSMITAVPGASAFYRLGVTAYHNEMKVRLLGVRDETLASHGAVSEQTAREMAEGVRRQAASTYGIGITGIAGPDGGSPDKPVGLVYGAVAGPAATQVYRLQLGGSREQIQIRASKHMLWRLWTIASSGKVRT